jgi:hypothetical protein
MLRFASGLSIPVRVHGLGTEALFAMVVARDVCETFGYDCEITSVVEGKHSTKSLHYTGDAFDFNIRQMEPGVAEKVCALLREWLYIVGDYDVILEATHIHVEYQPRRLA